MKSEKNPAVRKRRALCSRHARGAWHVCIQPKHFNLHSRQTQFTRCLDVGRKFLCDIFLRLDASPCLRRVAMAVTAIPWPSVPIAHLQPGLDAQATSVSGVVTLIWPYASSTRSASLLLVEPDFRLRRHRGQVRIHFNGASAKAVARLSVSSGDRLSLSLNGAEWAKDGATASTPGKGIEWELKYSERVVLQVWNC